MSDIAHGSVTVSPANAPQRVMATPQPPPLELRPLGPEWDERWDILVGVSPASGFMQSSAWAAFKRAEGHLTPRYGLFAGDEHLIGGGSLLLYPHGREAGFLICPEGPVLAWDDVPLARAGLRLLIAQAEELARQHGALGLRIEPHLPPPRPSLLRNWSRAPIDLMPVHTLMLDLTVSNDVLLANMHPKVRYNLRLSVRHGVEVIESEDMADLRAFYDVFTETALRSQIFAEPYGFFLNLGAALFPAKRASLFLARWQGQTLAAILVIYCGRRATYLYGGSLRQGRHVMPNYALHWAAFQAARTRGCVEYDFYGYDPFDQPEHLFAGISRFKNQWGARRVDSLGAHDLIFYDQLADRVIDRLNAEA
jgi:peptidoglycan pentaglycine glycine transferase (the first glycine)